ncbi:LysR family transcriptional regulator [Vibrio maerlii]|uniref:LysR family transcriptional regulator n=1 Tax=Vibrio maerlii TaxID=2231648 RepID=UPI0013DF350F|nr:LysR family transcriptional regulator [Vibrio maerlii]
MYNVDQLRMFVEAAELGSFSACARKLGKVQSAVSQGINNLEIDFNVQLFDRSTRKPTLTPEGRQLLKQARAIILQMEDFESSVKSIEQGDEERVRLVLDDAIFVDKLGKIFADFSECFPATELDVLAVATTDVIDRLTSGKADIGLMLTDMNFHKDVSPCFIGNLPFKAVTHPQHPLARLDSVDISDAIQYQQLLLKGENEHTLPQFPIVAAKVWWSNSFQVMCNMLKSAPIGWAYVPLHLVENDLNNHSLVALNIVIDHKAWSPPVDIVTLKSKSKGRALRWLEQHLKQLLDD